MTQTRIFHIKPDSIAVAVINHLVPLDQIKVALTWNRVIIQVKYEISLVKINNKQNMKIHNNNNSNNNNNNYKNNNNKKYNNNIFNNNNNQNKNYNSYNQYNNKRNNNSNNNNNNHFKMLM